MSKKLLSLIMIFSLCFCLTGCTDVIELTDTETRLISEYAGDLLLKYDVNFNDRIDQGEKIEKEMEEEAEEEAFAVTTEALSTEDTSANADTSEESDSNTGSNLNSQIDDSDEGDIVDNTDATVNTESDIAKILGLPGVSITYSDYVITDHYPATDADGQFLYLDAAEGYQLLVLKFNVSNVTDDTVSFSLLNEEVDYRIVCNHKNAANPMLTILLNDLGTMEAVLSPEETQEGVLIFQISEDMVNKLDAMELKVQYNNDENVITIL